MVVSVYGDIAVDGKGFCPACGIEVGGVLYLKNFTKRVGALTNDAKVRIFGKWLTKRHKDKCQAKITLPYDNRFNEMYRDPLSGKMRLPDYLKPQDFDISAL